VSSGPARRATLADRRLTLLFAVGALIALVVLVVALLTRSSSDAGQAAAPAPGAIHVATSKYGPILVDADGRTLYLFLADKHGRSTCDGSCAKVWPPLAASASTKPGTGISGTLLKTVRRDDGTSQVVYRNHPLYTMVADKRPGQMVGQAFLGTWFVVSPHGNAVTGGVKPSTGGY
jgi:predicted lipoprotein with Yx(FWY)xxD motif